MTASRSLAIALLASLAFGCGHQPAAPPASFTPQKLTAEHLPNPWQIHPKVISGGLPEGEAAFQQLEDLGVKTVISVDGAKPDVELAKNHGLRYVHLPHGYDGVPELRMKELAKAVRDLPGTIYIHCHHGKHRSPAASAVACIGGGLLNPAAGEPILLAAGTSDAYKGLYESVRTARQFESRLLDELNAEFPELARLPPLAEAMVALEHTHDHMKQVAAAGWKLPPQHPDIAPAHEALLLREHFTEMLRTGAVKQQPEKFQALLRNSEAAAQELETALREGKPELAARPFDLITANCKSCHTEFRDVPLSQKATSTR
jgi:hypothetical protein